MTYEQLLDMLRDMHPDIDFETEEGLIDMYRHLVQPLLKLNELEE